MSDEQPRYLGRFAGVRMPEREDLRRYTLAAVYSVLGGMSLDYNAAAVMRDKVDRLLFRQRRNETERQD